MNLSLQNEIFKHIFASFGIIKLDCIDHSSIDALNADKYKFNKIKFEDNTEVPVWGASAKSDDYCLNIFFADLTTGAGNVEYAMLVDLKDQPVFGIYYEIKNDNSISDRSVLSASMDGEVWIDADISVLSSFFAGMEQLKQYPNEWSVSDKNKISYNKFLNFIENSIDK